MPIAQIVLLVTQIAQLLAEDGPALATLFASASTAISNAQANGGKLTDADWAVLDAARAKAEAAFKAAAGE